MNIIQTGKIHRYHHCLETPSVTLFFCFVLFCFGILPYSFWAWIRFILFSFLKQILCFEYRFNTWVDWQCTESLPPLINTHLRRVCCCHTALHVLCGRWCVYPVPQWWAFWSCSAFHSGKASCDGPLWACVVVHLPRYTRRNLEQSRAVLSAVAGRSSGRQRRGRKGSFWGKASGSACWERRGLPGHTLVLYSCLLGAILESSSYFQWTFGVSSVFLNFPYCGKN